MPRQSFRYSRFMLPATRPFPSGQEVWRPLLITRLRSRSGAEFLCVSCADSGADACAFPLSYAIALNLDPLRMPQNQVGGVGNTGNTMHYEEINVELGHMTRDTQGDSRFTPFFSFRTLAGFTLGLEAQGFGLLGQAGFFEHHTLTFQHRERIFHVESL